MTSREAGLPKEDIPAFDDNYGGVDALARAIQHSKNSVWCQWCAKACSERVHARVLPAVLDRVKVSILDTNVTVIQLSGDRQRELALRLFLHK